MSQRDALPWTEIRANQMHIAQYTVSANSNEQ